MEDGTSGPKNEKSINFPKRLSVRALLASMVDVNYDAYARLELIDRLSCQAFRHGHTAPYLAKRAEMFRKIRKNVRKDRLENLDLVSPLSSSLVIIVVMPSSFLL